MKRLTPCLLASLYFLFTTAGHATIEFIYGIKERQYHQTDDSQPQTPVEWGFGAGASGDEQLTAVSVTPPGSDTPVMLDNDEGSYDLDIDGFQTQEELDESYPNGTLSFDITDNGEQVELPNFSITGDTYPNTPYFTNITDLYSHDLGLEFELTWNSFSNAGDDARIALSIWDQNKDEEIVFTFLESTATSFTIGENQLQADTAYECELLFINETDGLESPDTIIGYMSSTRFYLTTYSSDTALGFYKIKTHRQTTSDGVQDLDYRARSTVNANSNSVTFAEVVTDAGFYALDQIVFESFFRRLDIYESEALLDASYPAGDLAFGLLEGGENPFYGFYHYADDDYPEVPLFSNFFELLNFDATQEQSIEWGAAPGDVALVDLLIFDGSSTFVWGHTPTEGVTAVQLPANTLVQNEQYNLVIRFWKETLSSENPSLSAGYMSLTSLNIETSEGGGGDPGIEFIYAIKQREFIQVDDTAPTNPISWNFDAGVNGGSNVTGGSVSYPGGNQVFVGEFGEYDTENPDFESMEALNAAFPNGEYTVNVIVDGENQAFGPFDISGDAYPPIPHILNADDLSAHDLSQPFTLNWNAFTGSTTSDRILIQMENYSGGGEEFFQFLEANVTSFEFPGDTFKEGNQYEISVIFINEVDEQETPDAIIGYLSTTNKDVSLVTSDTVLRFYKWRRFGQSGPDTFEATGYRPFARVAGVSNSVTHAEMTSDVFYLNIPNIAQNLFIHLPPYGSKELLDSEYPPGEYVFRLEENGEPVEYAPYILPPDNYPDHAEISNYDELQGFDASLEQMIGWDTPPGNLTLISLRMLDQSFNTVWTAQLAPSATSAVIPPDTLINFQSYTLIVVFWIEEAGSELPDASLGYMTSTQLGIETYTDNIDFPTWQSLRFTEEQLLDEEIVGEDADPDGDRLSNVLEFMLGTDPNDGMSGSLYRLDDTAGRILIIGPLPANKNWELQSSTDMSLWATLDAQHYQLIGDELHVDLDSLPNPTFLRLLLSDT